MHFYGGIFQPLIGSIITFEFKLHLIMVLDVTGTVGTSFLLFVNELMHLLYSAQ